MWLNPDHGGWIREMAEVAGIVWCTSWQHLTSTWVAEQLGLPTGWPHVPGAVNDVRWGRSLKLLALYEFTEDRPVAVLDNMFGGKDDGVAEYRTENGKPTLLVQVDGHVGLRRSDVDRTLQWLSQL